MKIPTKILDEYGIRYDETTDDNGVYQTFLIKTDYEIIKGFESLLGDPLKFIANVATLAKTLKGICEYRAIAREELNKGK